MNNLHLVFHYLPSLFTNIENKVAICTYKRKFIHEAQVLGINEANMMVSTPQSSFSAFKNKIVLTETNSEDF